MSLGVHENPIELVAHLVGPKTTNIFCSLILPTAPRSIELICVAQRCNPNPGEVVIGFLREIL